MRVAVCDDDIMALQMIRNVVMELDIVGNVDVYSDIEKFKQVILHNIIYDVVIMDIEWNGQKIGIDVAVWLYEIRPNIRIIFETGYNDKYSQVFLIPKTNIMGYVNKPIEKEYLKAYLMKTKNDILEKKKYKLHIKPYNKDIPFSEIKYIESRGHQVIVHTRNNYAYYDKLNNIKELLSENFVYCHKSYIINLEHTKNVERGKVIMDDDKEINITTMPKKKMEEIFFHYLKNAF